MLNSTHKTMLTKRLTLTLVALLLTMHPAASRAQADTIQSKAWKMGMATGPSFFYGEEGNTIGVQLESTLLRRLRGNRLWARLEMTSHLYGAQTLYPCGLSVNGTCFNTSQRAVFGGGIGLQYFFRQPVRSTRSVPHLTLGIATYVSKRRAEAAVSCQPSALCPDDPIWHELTDTDLGINVGFGQTWSTGRNEFFIESRLHHPFVPQNAGSYTRYRIFPLTLGMRF
jgi:hypothetical protein